MAFQQQSRQAQALPAQPTYHDTPSPPQVHAPSPQPDEAHTWVLFSPVTEDTTTTTTTASYLSEDARSPTPGRSRLSVDTNAARSSRLEGESSSLQSALLSAAVDDDDDESVAEEDAELDSLDSHLPEFHMLHSHHGQMQLPLQAPQEAAGLQQSVPVLPTHDGLGSFRLDRGASDEVQDQLYAFERFNPRRVPRRRGESFDITQLEVEGDEMEEEVEKRQRIEAWRLEHSRALLEEIQRETRRRRQSQASSRPQMQAASVSRGAESEAAASTSHSLAESARTVSRCDSLKEAGEMDWHSDTGAAEEEGEGFWSRMTRKVIRDLMGIDDHLLAILFGEALPEEEDLSSTPRASPSSHTRTRSGSGGASFLEAESSWQLHVLDHVAKELGLLVNHLSTHHPGAFSTYVRMQQMPLPYAGLPVIPESSTPAAPSLAPPAEEGQQLRAAMPEFQPTMAHAQPINIPGVRLADHHHHQADMLAPSASFLLQARDDVAPQAAAGTNSSFTQEEWEQDLDIKLVFRYLRSRFTSRGTSTGSIPFVSGGTAHLSTSSTQETAAKAARVRQHHPLVSSSRVARPAERRGSFKAMVPTSPVALRHSHGHAHAPSCASQSSRRSARRSSISSRHYWDIGASKGSGSVIASTGPMGSWGEV